MIESELFPLVLGLIKDLRLSIYLKCATFSMWKQSGQLSDFSGSRAMAQSTSALWLAFFQITDKRAMSEYTQRRTARQN